MGDGTQVRISLIVGVLIAAGILTKVVGKISGSSVVEQALFYVRTLLYISVIILWITSVLRRIIQKQVKYILLAAACLMLFWLFIRTVKYRMVLDIDVIRYMWYSYYIPMILVPLCFLYISFYQGKGEKYTLPIPLRIAFVPGALLILMVMTNDLHGFVFHFLSKPYKDSDMEYAPGYFVIVGFVMIAAIVGIVLIVRNRRLPRSRHIIWLPLIPMIVGVVYAVLYALRIPFVFKYINDITVMIIFACLATFEGCIRVGLIPSNSGYEVLFKASTINAGIYDLDYELYLSSDNLAYYSERELYRSLHSPLLLDDGYRISQAKINGGYVLWQEDVSELLAVLDELKETKESLSDSVLIMQENYDTEKRISALSEQNRLYDMIQSVSASQTMLINGLIMKFLELDSRKYAALDDAEDTGSSETKVNDELRKILGQILIIGVFVKRESNLIFIQQRDEIIPVKELDLCFEETMKDLRLIGIDCSYSDEFGHLIDSDLALKIYNFFEKVIEECFGILNAVSVNIKSDLNCYYMHVGVECSKKTDMSNLAASDVFVKYEGDSQESLWDIMYVLPKGGAV